MGFFINNYNPSRFFWKHQTHQILILEISKYLTMLLSHENLITIIYFSHHIHSDTIRQCYQLPKYSYWYWKNTPPVTESLSSLRIWWHELLTRLYKGRCSWAHYRVSLRMSHCERCVPVAPPWRRCWFGGWGCRLTKWFPTIQFIHH